MSANDLTYQDYLNRINIQEVLQHAGYTLNRRDGLRYPSYVRIGSDGRRVHGDKFIVTRNGDRCFQPPEQRTYNVISFIKNFPHLFPQHAGITNPDHLVNEVCRDILNVPRAVRAVKVLEPRKEIKPFNIKDYELTSFRKYDFESIKKFYPYFKSRGISIDTQKAFGDHFMLATKTSQSNASQTKQRHAYTNLSFPMKVPGKEAVVGFEERGRARLDGTSGYKGKAMGSNSTEGLWIANLGKQELSSARNVYWFESAYDAMAYYQLHRDNKDVQQGVFVSTGGNPTVGQLRGMLSVSLTAKQHVCFDNDLAGRQFADNLTGEFHKIVLSRVQTNDANKDYLESIPAGKGYLDGDVDMLPQTLYKQYGKLESACQEAISMRQGGLSHVDDVKQQENQARAYFAEYRQSLRAFLGLDKLNEGGTVREVPAHGKDWNEQLLDDLKASQEASIEDNDESQKVAAGIDLDVDGSIEVEESEEKKRTHSSIKR